MLASRLFKQATNFTNKRHFDKDLKGNELNIKIWRADDKNHTTIET